MSFDAKWDEKILEKAAREIVHNAIILGYSDSEKDCYWTCYEYGDKYYIGLNDGNDIWEVEESDIDDYNHNPI